MGSHTPTSDVAFTPAVKAVQERLGSRSSYARMEEGRSWSDAITPDLAEYLGTRSSVYLATATAEGQPYVQHRGGPAGFLKILDDKTIAFADYRGNKQYISMGNLEENDRAFLFAMDYANRRRVKLWGRAEFVEDDPDLLARVADPDYTGKPERVLRFHVEAYDWNCPQHIPRLLSEEQVEAVVAERTRGLQDRIVELERALAARTD